MKPIRKNDSPSSKISKLARGPYASPHLVEWGSVQDLTKGTTGLFPDAGGTTPNQETN